MEHRTTEGTQKAFCAASTSPAEELKCGIIALGQGFSDMGQYISRSITLLTFALIVRSVVDFGFLYILGMVWVLTVAFLVLWVLHLQSCIAQYTRSNDDLNKELRKAEDVLKNVYKLETEAVVSRCAISRLESEQGSLQCELEEAHEKQRTTELQLEKANIMLLKQSHELTLVRSATQKNQSAPRESNCFELAAEGGAKKRRSM